MPSDVPESATSMSCTASALPESSTFDVAEPDQVAEILRAAGVHHHRAGDERDLAAVGLDAPHHLGDARHRVSTRRSDDTSLLMKPKLGLSRDCTSGDDANALHAADDQIALADIAQLLAGDPRS